MKGDNNPFAYRSIFKASSWLFDPLVLTVKPVRKLTGILELPGIFRDVEEEWSLPGFGRRQHGIIRWRHHMLNRTSLSRFISTRASPLGFVPQHPYGMSIQSVYYEV
jgi:hypothetical protein